MVIATLVTAFYQKLWNAWDDNAVDEVLSATFRFRGSLGTETIGRDGWRRYRDQVRRGAPDFDNEILTLIAEGDRAAARLRYTGTNTGGFAGFPSLGRRFEYAGAAFFEAVDGRLVSAWVLGDVHDLSRQLGPRG